MVREYCQWPSVIFVQDDHLSSPGTYQLATFRNSGLDSHSLPFGRKIAGCQHCHCGIATVSCQGCNNVCGVLRGVLPHSISGSLLSEDSILEPPLKTGPKLEDNAEAASCRAICQFCPYIFSYNKAHMNPKLGSSPELPTLPPNWDLQHAHDSVCLTSLLNAHVYSILSNERPW